MAVIEIRDVLDNETGKTIFPRTHVNAVIGLEDFSFFEKVQDTQDPTKYSVKLKSEYTGLWTEGWLAAGGVGSGSGGGGGVSYLKELTDIYHNANDVLRADGTAVQNGDSLVYDSANSRWIAAAVSGGGGGASYLNDLLDVDAVNPSNGQSLIYDSAQSKWIPGLVNTGGVSLSLSPSATYLTDSNGRYLKDSTGKYLVTSGTTSSINLLDASGTVLSSVSIPSVDASSFLTGFVPASRRINGHDLSADVTLNASDIGLGNVENTALSSWSGSSAITTLGTISSGSIPLSLVTGADDLKAIEGLTGTSGLLRKTAADTWSLDTTNYVPNSRKINGVDLSADRTFYVGTSQIQSSSRAQDLTGISSVKASSDAASMFAWDADLGAWHFYGNVYADGWMAAGGIGSGSSGGSNVSISNLLASGTRVATVTIDGIGYDILAPSAGGITTESDPVFNESAAAGITQADIDRWNNAGGSSVSVSQLQTTGTAIAAITVDGVRTTIYAPTSGGIASETDPIFSASAAAGITAANITAWNNKSDFSGSYNDLTNKPTIPTAVSQLTNDSEYVTSQALNTALAGYATNLDLAKKQDKYPFTISGDSGATYNLANYVTLDTDQTISGAKTFSADLTILSTAKIKLGPITLEYDFSENALHITSNDNSTVNLYCDGYIAAGGVQQSA